MADDMIGGLGAAVAIGISKVALVARPADPTLLMSPSLLVGNWIQGVHFDGGKIGMVMSSSP